MTGLKQATIIFDEFSREKVIGSDLNQSTLHCSGKMDHWKFSGWGPSDDPGYAGEFHNTKCYTRIFAPTDGEWLTKIRKSLDVEDSVIGVFSLDCLDDEMFFDINISVCLAELEEIHSCLSTNSTKHKTAIKLHILADNSSELIESIGDALEDIQLEEPYPIKMFKIYALAK